jgi:hypothetical protein
MAGVMKPMRWQIPILVCALCVAGCSSFNSKPSSPAASNGEAHSAQSGKKVLVTPATGPSGKVASVNGPGRFVVITFQVGQGPAVDQKLQVYRGVVKVGEVKVSREQLGQNFVADIISGEARVGDEVRTE